MGWLKNKLCPYWCSKCKKQRAFKYAFKPLWYWGRCRVCGTKLIFLGEKDVV